MKAIVINAMNIKERILREWKKLITSEHPNTVLTRYGSELIIKDEDTEEILMVINEVIGDRKTELFAMAYAI